MLSLVREIDDLSLAPFALRYILEAVDGADNASIAIREWLDVNERDATRAVRPSMWTSCSRRATPVLSTSAIGH
jgi:hypothetical protein